MYEGKGGIRIILATLVGGIDEGETIEEAAKREALEELGLGIEVEKIGEVTHQYDWPGNFNDPDGRKGQIKNFVLAIYLGADHIKMDPNEVEEYKWAGWTEIRKYFNFEDQIDIFKKVVEEFKLAIAD